MSANTVPIVVRSVINEMLAERHSQLTDVDEARLQGTSKHIRELIATEIKAAEDKRGKEVLELACEAPDNYKREWSIPWREDFERHLRQAYQERFGL